MKRWTRSTSAGAPVGDDRVVIPRDRGFRARNHFRRKVRRVREPRQMLALTPWNRRNRKYEFEQARIEQRPAKLERGAVIRPVAAVVKALPDGRRERCRALRMGAMLRLDGFLRRLCFTR